jgi:hypothetical protein
VPVRLCQYPGCKYADKQTRECSLNECSKALHHMCASGYSDARFPTLTVEHICEWMQITAGGSVCFSCFTRLVPPFLDEAQRRQHISLAPGAGTSILA